ncbi:MAG: rhodanese-like domain-containing protein [Bacteriovoracia bacterium]
MKALITLLLTIFSLTAAASDPQNAYSMVEKGEAVIIDVREKDEVEEGMIKNAKWFPLSKVMNAKDWKKDFKKLTEGKKIFLYCRSGNRSGKVLNILKENGITSSNLGGYEDLLKVLK